MNLEAVKLVAWASMLVSHAGMVFAPSSLAPLLVGRVALPLFVFLVAYRCRFSTRDRGGYAARLLLWSLVAQPAWMLLGLPGGNVLLTLSLAVLAIDACARRPEATPAVPALLAAASIVELLLGWRLSDGGAAAVLATVAIFAAFDDAAWWFVVPLAVSVLNAVGRPVEDGALLAIAAFAAGPIVVLLGRYPRMPRLGRSAWWYAAYPLHLYALWAMGVLL